MLKFLAYFFLLLVTSFSAGCTTVVVSYVIEPTVGNLQRQTDLDLVCEGAPAFLLAVDSFIVSEPKNSAMLMTGVQAYSAYAAALAECGRPERGAQLAEKSKQYGLALLSLGNGMAPALAGSLEDFDKALQRFSSSEAEKLFWGGYGWASYVGSHTDSPAALADLVRVERIMRRVLELDETCSHGGAHLFLGVYYGSRPQMLGGKPEESRAHFERALELSGRRFLSAQVAYAEYYARTQFDRELHDRLLQEVLDFSLESAPELALGNQVAKHRARRLLAEADTYF